MITAGTIELWVRLSSTPTPVGSLVNRGTGNNDANVLTYLGTPCDQTVAIFSRTSGTTVLIDPCGTIPPQGWIHIAAVNDGTTLTLYLNGVPNMAIAYGGSYLGPLATDLWIGRREPGIFPFSGDIDEIKWWTIARTQSEICTDAWRRSRSAAPAPTSLRIAQLHPHDQLARPSGRQSASVEPYAYGASARAARRRGAPAGLGQSSGWSSSSVITRSIMRPAADAAPPEEGDDHPPRRRAGLPPDQWMVRGKGGVQSTTVLPTMAEARNW